MTQRTTLRAVDLVVGYGGPPVLNQVSFDVPVGELTVIVGPNACGKSTLLRALARLLPVRSGVVELDAQAISSLPTKLVARKVAMLPQGPSAPPGATVLDVVTRGRYPHRSLFGGWSQHDEAITTAAMRTAGVLELAERPLDELSGGQRQRAWIAMTLAQDTDIILLDEPTTYLDLSHQIEVLEVARTLQQRGHTVVVVLHELQLAFRYATHLVVMSHGEIVTQGSPNQVISAELIERVFDVPCTLLNDPVTGTPIVIPLVTHSANP